MSAQPPEPSEGQESLPDGLPDGVECPICEEGFDAPEELERHMKEEHG